MRTGRCESFAEAAATMAERRSQLHGARARARRSALGGTGTHPWSRWQDQRIIDTPHYRRNDELLRYVVWRNNTFGLHVHVGIARRRPRDRRARRAAQLPARAARAVGQLAVRRGRRTPACTRRARRSSRACSRAAASPTPTTAGTATSTTSRFLYDTGSITSTRRSGGASARISRFRPSRSASATPSPTSARRSRSPRSSTRSPRGCARAHDEGEPLPIAAAPAARGEPVARDPLRALRRADRPRARRVLAGPRTARAARSSGSRRSPRSSARRAFLAVPGSETPPSVADRGASTEGATPRARSDAG